MSIHIYAEHLINIRTLNIQVSLPTLSNPRTAVTLSAGGGTLKVDHDGETASITLPISIPGNNSNTLQTPSTPSKELSFRVRLTESNGTAPSLQKSQSGETVVPWTAASLHGQMQFGCTHCHTAIVPRGKVSQWKDLPSEGWAEMMEFWHCHKPNEPHTHEHQTDKKGYSADSSLSIVSSIGLVSATSFTLSPDDCINIEVGFGTKLSLSTKEIFRDWTGPKEPALSGRKATFIGRFGIRLPKKKLSGAVSAAIPAQAVGSLATLRSIALAVFRLSDFGAQKFGRDLCLDTCLCIMKCFTFSKVSYLYHLQDSWLTNS